jgi:hypothetical protein
VLPSRCFREIACGLESRGSIDHTLPPAEDRVVGDRFADHGASVWEEVAGRGARRTGNALKIA